MSKRKLNQSVSLSHFGFTSKKVTPRDDQETLRDDADDAAASTALATRTVSESGAPVPPSHSPEGGEVEAECSEDAAVAELAATAASDFPPAGWTTKQVGKWKDRNPWLDIKAGKLGCLVCRKAKTLLLSEKGPGLHLSEEWINAYTVAKERLSYKKLNPLMTMQELNGAEVGNNHKSDHACAEIISHIAKEIRRKFVSNVKEMDSKVSITIDESTVHGHPYLIIYVRCDVSGKGDVDNVFLDIVELTDGVDAESIYNSMMASREDAPNKHSHRWGCSAHGKSQLACRQTQKQYSEHAVCRLHCLAHRLELSVKDALKEVGGTNQFEIFISHLYSLYNQSTMNSRLLKEAAAELNMEILKIGQIFTIRWVASSFKTVKAVWKDFPTLALHFKTSSENASRDLERQKYKGLLKHLTNSGFVEKILAVMKDILGEL
ncbi:hypothetical protein F7725_026971 [Dissostichus mawsoni]|uniref:DUF4371 domain-containing protein n=1 Tax=Dissostichus mawsoni TaxID=36200 RepID=A0A7J5X8I9_DISMA|nr:hypothetical protein F7725_026971 [Dissostichus mawsoni]